MFSKLNSRIRILTGICLSLTTLIAAICWSGLFLEGAEQAARDWVTTNPVGRRLPPNPDIIFLAIDEDSRSLDTVFKEDFDQSPTLRLMKQGYPWNRAVYADIIERLCASGARAILFDIVYPGEKSGDDAFRAALEKHADKVVIGTRFTDNVEIGAGVPSYDLPGEKLRPPPGSPSWLGYVNVRPDSDGLVRSMTYRTTELEFSGIPSDGTHEELLALTARGLEKAGLQDRIPRGHQPVMFRIEYDVQPHSLHQIFVEDQWNSPTMYNHGEFFRNKIVFVGSVGASSEDRLQTPAGVNLGSQIHLTALNSAINQDFMRHAAPSTNMLFVFGNGLIAWLLGALIRRPILRLVLLVLAIFLVWGFVQNLANNTGIVLIIFSPLLALTTSSITWAAWEQIADRAERQRTRRALERYVGHDVAGEVLDNPASYLDTLGGKRKDVTILFSDIRGFTTLTESADAHELVTQLNEYFTEMVAIVFAQQGTLDKFIGDAVMAHWGGIVSAGPETDAVRAVTTALEMFEALKKLNADWKTRGITEWAIGIGLNHGAPITGNIGASGARERFDFTVVGDAVNLASRLEGTTKNFHIDLCIGETVAALVRNQFPLRSVDLIIVKGKTKPVEIFTVLGKQGTPAPSWLPVHDEAMRCYRAGEFAAAEAAWRQVLEQVPGDGLTETMLARCAELQKFPPPAPWTGVYEMKSK